MQITTIKSKLKLKLKSTKYKSHKLKKIMHFFKKKKAKLYLN